MEIPWVLRVWTETIKFIRFSSIPPCSLALFSLIFFFWNNIVKKSPFEISKRSVRCGKFPGFCLFKRKKKKKIKFYFHILLPLLIYRFRVSGEISRAVREEKFLGFCSPCWHAVFSLIFQIKALHWYRKRKHVKFQKELWDVDLFPGFCLSGKYPNLFSLCFCSPCWHALFPLIFLNKKSSPIQEEKTIRIFKKTCEMWKFSWVVFV